MLPSHVPLRGAQSELAASRRGRRVGAGKVSHPCPAHAEMAGALPPGFDVSGAFPSEREQPEAKRPRKRKEPDAFPFMCFVVAKSGQQPAKFEVVGAVNVDRAQVALAAADAGEEEQMRDFHKHASSTKEIVRCIR
eukprot:8051320-Alexandrium_andersonii.AAC.1